MLNYPFAVTTQQAEAEPWTPPRGGFPGALNEAAARRWKAWAGAEVRDHPESGHESHGDPDHASDVEAEASADQRHQTHRSVLDEMAENVQASLKGCEPDDLFVAVDGVLDDPRWRRAKSSANLSFDERVRLLSIWREPEPDADTDPETVKRLLLLDRIMHRLLRLQFVFLAALASRSDPKSQKEVLERLSASADPDELLSDPLVPARVRSAVLAGLRLDVLVVALLTLDRDKTNQELQDVIWDACLTAGRTFLALVVFFIEYQTGDRVEVEETTLPREERLDTDVLYAEAEALHSMREATLMQAQHRRR